MTESNMKNLCINYRYPVTQPVQSLDFHHSGKYLVLADDECIKHIGLEETEVKEFQSVKCKKTGLGEVKFLQDSNMIAYTTKKCKDNYYCIRILDAFEHHIDREYNAHKDEITGLHWSSPQPKLLLSSSKDKTCILWDLSQHKIVNRITFESSMLISTLHPLENIFTVLESNSIQSFDLRYLSSKTQKTYETKLILKPNIECRGLRYSFDGKKILVTTNSNCIIVGDPTKTENDVVISEFSDFKNVDKDHIGASFDPFTNYCIGGSSDGFMNIWNIATQKKICRYHHTGKGKVSNVFTNPKYFMFVTCGQQEIDFWSLK